MCVGISSQGNYQHKMIYKQYLKLAIWFDEKGEYNGIKVFLSITALMHTELFAGKALIA